MGDSGPSLATGFFDNENRRLLTQILQELRAIRALLQPNPQVHAVRDD